MLRQQIRNYYGDPRGSGTFGSDSNYANEASSAAAAGARWLQARAHAVKGPKAIVLDVDDTTLATWNYEIYLKTACADELAAGKSCTTVHYKSATRAHIESLGYEIVGNFGDQFSDLEGGHADRTFKLPNPNYFLP